MDDFYSGKSVVVTGGSGMIGYQLVKKLSALGAHVIVMDNKSRGNNILQRPNVQYAYKADASRAGSCEWCFKGMSNSGEPVFAVFNLAASVAGVFHNQDNNVAMFNENILLQTIPVQVAQYVGVPHFLQVSSVCVYDPMYNHPSQEEMGMQGNPHQSNYGYAMAKRMGESMAKASDLSHVIIVRPSNVYGLYDYFDERAHVIPALIKRIHAGGDVHVYSPDFVREFIYSEDVADGMIAALRYGGHKEVYNLGWNGNPKQTFNIGDLAQAILRVLDNGAHLIPTDGRPGGEKLRWSDSTKAYKELGWSPKVGLESGGLEEVVEWYLENQDEL